MEEITYRSRIAPSESRYGFEVIHERLMSDGSWNREGRSEFWIRDGMILMLGMDAGGRDCCDVPTDAKQTRMIADLLGKLADDLESGAWKV